jgi:cyclic pyranopterin monophosphate synthase
MTGLTHLDEHGAARMVDVGDKAVTRREANAEGFIEMAPNAIAAVRSVDTKKGDVIAAARIAGIMAAKRTSDLIPLCHPIALDTVAIDFDVLDDRIAVTAKVVSSGKTGVEMEALTAASVALLTLYDMTKSMGHGMTITGVRVIAKSGGTSGDYRA